MSRRACRKCGRVKEVSEFPSVSGAPVCSECAGRPPGGATGGKREEANAAPASGAPGAGVSPASSALEKHRAWARASQRAMRRLAKENPERYKLLLEEEKEHAR